jgi:hypothetical protein
MVRGYGPSGIVGVILVTQHQAQQPPQGAPQREQKEPKQGQEKGDKQGG